MATVESINRRLDELDGDRAYFSIEEILLALSRPLAGESLLDTMHREHPSKTINPSMVESLCPGVK
ncbi:MAG: hypothetical protein DRR42_23525 [Gammaproteobacteria bacterium]|nr:MAG: hypothetical protein DRR42_23525 [Gammaproteobacteria bacterium]